MILLDTNILSELIKSTPSAGVEAWLDRQVPDEIWLSSISLFETRFGFALMPAGKRRADLETRFERVLDLIEHQIWDFDAPAAAAAAEMAGHARRAGVSIEFRDAFIAGVAFSRQATLATHNVRHFQGLGLNLIDPFTS